MGWCSKWSLGTSRGYILIEHLHWFLHTYIEQLEVILYTIDFGKSACISTNTIVNTLKTLSALTAAEKANCWRVYNIFAGHTLLCNKSGWWFQTFFYFSIVYGIILPIDFHIFQDGLKPPSRNYQRVSLRNSSSSWSHWGWPRSDRATWKTPHPIWRRRHQRGPCWGHNFGMVKKRWFPIKHGDQ